MNLTSLISPLSHSHSLPLFPPNPLLSLFICLPTPLSLFASFLPLNHLHFSLPFCPFPFHYPPLSPSHSPHPLLSISSSTPLSLFLYFLSILFRFWISIYLSPPFHFSSSSSHHLPSLFSPPSRSFSPFIPPPLSFSLIVNERTIVVTKNHCTSKRLPLPTIVSAYKL